MAENEEIYPKKSSPFFRKKTAFSWGISLPFWPFAVLYGFRLYFCCYTHSLKVGMLFMNASSGEVSGANKHCSLKQAILYPETFGCLSLILYRKHKF